MILNKKIVLASTSRYRADLLTRLQRPFTVVAPGIDEKVLPDEGSEALARRLSVEKAQAVAVLYTGQPVLVIGADQVADLNGRQLGKPRTRDGARIQLRGMRGQRLTFHSGLAVIDCSDQGQQSAVIATHVTMRQLTDLQIENYLDREDALDCAGSAKSEGLGIALIASIQSDDPTALVGLPLIALIQMLTLVGVDMLDSPDE